MSLYFGNAFSLNMIDESCSISIIKMNDQEKIDSIINEAESVIGHVDLARILKVPYNRSSITLTVSDALLVAQYKGSRLSEGATKLPDDATIEYFLVCVHIIPVSFKYHGSIIMNSLGFNQGISKIGCIMETNESFCGLDLN